MNVWLFQAVPEYDLTQKVPLKMASSKLDAWMATRYRNEMHTGETVLFWQAGQLAGIYATGRLSNKRHQVPYLSEDGDWCVDVRYTQILPNPIFKEELSKLPSLRDLSILHLAFQGTNFKVRQAEWKVLQKLIAQEKAARPLSKRVPVLNGLSSEDTNFFFHANDEPPKGKFTFKPGHNPKKTGTVVVNTSKKSTTADLLHNEMQNSLVGTLRKKYGKNNVGSEQGTGSGTSIDIVVKTGKSNCFYEIKTDRSVKACIRQAIPQLLEYAYWQGEAGLVNRLIIVGTSAITKEADTYLAFLRMQFGLEIYYEQHDIAK